MKKMFLGAALTAALIIISCTKSDFQEELGQTPIMFTPLIEQNTRGIINGTTYPTTETFNATAYYKPSGGTYNFTNAGKYFDNMQISYVGASSSWKSAGSTYYWPPQGALKFIATSPYGVVTPSYDATNGIQFPSFGQSTTTPIDLMYAESANDLTSGSVPLTFKHALTQLYFTIKVQALLGLSLYRVKKIDVLNVYNGGSFKSLPTPTWTTTGTNNSTFNVYDDPTGVSLVLGGSPYEFPNRLLLIPQSVSGIVIRITYDSTTLGILTLGATKNITLSGNAWQPNQRIKYAITITQLL